MPAGVPVGTLAIGKAGAINAALLAASVLALNDPALAGAPRGLAKAADRRGQGASGGLGVTASNQVKLKPGDTIGILGGGQLGRMLAMAAARAWPEVPGVLARTRTRPPSTWSLNACCAEYADVEALELFANDVDIITYEFENVPAATAMVLAARRPVLPAHKILETTQDRLIEKDFVTRLGIGTADYAGVSSVETLRDADRAHRAARRDQDPPLRL